MNTEDYQDDLDQGDIDEDIDEDVDEDVDLDEEESSEDDEESDDSTSEIEDDDISFLKMVDAKPMKNKINNIYKHISKYEMTRILGFRSQQIAEGSPIYVEIPQDVIDPLEIAILEYNLGLIPVLLIREYNNEKPGETIETINTLDSLIKFNPLY